MPKWSRIRLTTQQTLIQSLGQKASLKKEMATGSSSSVWKSHGKRSLLGYSEWSHKRVRHNLAKKQLQNELWNPARG